MSSKKPIVNCHTHIFTGNHVPPYLAKTFVPIFYRLIHLGWIISRFKWWYNGPYQWFYHSTEAKCLKEIWYKIGMYIDRSKILNTLYWLIGIFLSLQTFLIITNLFYEAKTTPAWILALREFLERYLIDLSGSSTFVQISTFIIFILIFPSLRNLLFSLLKLILKQLRAMPGKQTKELFQRYLNIGRFAFHDGQGTIFQRLRHQYPSETEFIVLPMDMEFMDAGKVPEDYYLQLDALAKLKANPRYRKIMHPFLFVDPRRITKDPNFFKYKIQVGKIVLEDCIVKNYIEQKGFAGFKIYPALGYYPFDERLLPLWKYAAENNIPIMTHCIRGTIFYRGKKEKDWDYHPIFQQSNSKGTFGELLLPEIKNVDFTVNFTHPLNYLCLLEDHLLTQLIAQAGCPKVKEAFGYENGQVNTSLKKLKICFAHFGGDDEWKRYFELDRDNHSTQVIKNPKVGISFFPGPSEPPTPGKIEQLWKDCDWYSIICSMMLQYEKVYADVSYISHDNAIHSLLKRSLQSENTKLRKRILFGTDFYVVRNHKSEKQILADTIGGLTEEEFDLIARENPRTYLR